MGNKYNFSATKDLAMAGVELDGQCVRESFGTADSVPAIKLGSEFITLAAGGSISKPIPKGSKFKVIAISGFYIGAGGGAGDNIVVAKNGDAIMTLDTHTAATGDSLQMFVGGYDVTKAVLDGDAGDVLNVVATAAAGDTAADLVVELLRVL